MGEAASFMANIVGTPDQLRNALVFIARWCDATDRRLHHQLVDDHVYQYPYIIVHGRLKLYPGERDEIVTSFTDTIRRFTALEAHLRIYPDMQDDVDMVFVYDFQSQQWM